MTNTWFLALASPSIASLKRVPSLAVAFSSTPAQIRILSSRRSLASFAKCPPTNPLNVPLRLRTFGPKFSLRIVSIQLCSASSVSARPREFGIRLAIGSQPRQLLAGVIAEGAVMAVAGIVVGAAGGYALARLAGGYFQDMQMPGAIVAVASALILLAAAVIASALPAARAARIDVIQALRAE